MKKTSRIRLASRPLIFTSLMIALASAGLLFQGDGALRGNVSAQTSVAVVNAASFATDRTVGPESIAAAFDRQNGVPGTIVHFTGSFHSDFGAGTAERVRRRLSGRRVAVVSMLPVEDIDTVAPGPDDAGRAEYLVYTVK